MPQSAAIVGAGVSGLTCAVVLTERGYRVRVFAEETGKSTTSAVAAAIWYPYDAEPADAVIAWSLHTYRALADLSRKPRTGVSMIELRTFARSGEVQIPDWAIPLGAGRLGSSVMSSGVARHAVASCEGWETSLTVHPSDIPAGFTSGFALKVPLTDTTIYLDYLANRLIKAGGEIKANVHFDKLEDIGPEFELIINCSGIGAQTLVPDADLEPHRGQVAIVPKISVPYAVACDDPPLMYAIPRTSDHLFGGTNDLSNNRNVDPAATQRILTECSRVLGIEKPKVLEQRVGLRPFRRSGVCLRADRLRDGRTVIHNYGHGGSGFTLSWGCAQEVFALAGSG